MYGKHRAGYVFEPVCQLRRFVRATHSDRVEEGPRRARYGVRDEGLDVVGADLAVETVEGQLLQLGDGELSLSAAVYVSLSDVGPDAFGQQRGGGPGDAYLALPGAIADPARHLVAARCLELA